MSEQQRNFAAGFTLIELLVVLVIIAVVLALVVPAVKPPERSLVIKANALALVGQIKELRAAALHSNVDRALFVDVNRNVFWVDRVTSYRKLAPTLSVGAGVRPSDVVSPGIVRFIFYSDGTAGGGELVLRDGNRAAAISIDWRTGTPLIRWSG